MRKIESLPKWAQSEIVNLRAEVASLKDDLRAAACQKETRTYVASYEFDRKAQTFLPDDCQVRFEVARGYIEVYRAEKDECIGIRSMGILSASLRIYPLLSNNVLVYLGDTP